MLLIGDGKVSPCCSWCSRIVVIKDAVETCTGGMPYMDGPHKRETPISIEHYHRKCAGKMIHWLRYGRPREYYDGSKQDKKVTKNPKNSRWQ
jgi:hypothetical protein